MTLSATEFGAQGVPLPHCDELMLSVVVWPDGSPSFGVSVTVVTPPDWEDEIPTCAVPPVSATLTTTGPFEESSALPSASTGVTVKLSGCVPTSRRPVTSDSC